MNTQGSALVLNDPSGTITNGNCTSVLGLVISRTLIGTLTLSGISAANGSPQAWSLAPGTVAGFYAAPGPGTGGRHFSYTLSSPTDSGAAFLSWVP